MLNPIETTTFSPVFLEKIHQVFLKIILHYRDITLYVSSNVYSYGVNEGRGTIPNYQLTQTRLHFSCPWQQVTQRRTDQQWGRPSLIAAARTLSNILADPLHRRGGRVDASMSTQELTSLDMVIRDPNDLNTHVQVRIFGYIFYFLA